jgi:peptidoglycan/LPS O-acetylase OafA/YrhL
MLFVLVSPLLRAALRRFPWLVAGGVGLLWAVTLQLGVADRFATYLAAWTFGMAVAIRPSIAGPRRRWAWISVGSLAVGSVVFFSLTGPDAPPAGQRWGVVSVLLLGTAWIAGSLAFKPQLQVLADRRRVAPVVTWLNSRAVSVYLWHFPAYAAGVWVAGQVLGGGWDVAHAAVSFAVAVPTTFLLATAFGWLEDVAARRRLVLVPGRRRSASNATGSVAAAGTSG